LHFKIESAKYVIIISAIWAIAGMLYFAIETYFWLDQEATSDIDQLTPVWQILAYGPLYWIMAIVTCALGWLVK